MSHYPKLLTPDPVSTSANSGATVAEARDAVLGSYTFTAVAGRRYNVYFNGTAFVDGAGSYQVMIRNGGATTPTTASPAVASVAFTADAASSYAPAVMLGQISPGAGVQTLSMFISRISGAGNVLLAGLRMLWVDEA